MRRTVLLLATASALSFSTTALAQEVGSQNLSADEAEAKAAVDDIVVTGTLIRGQAPTGSQIVSVGQAEIAAQGFVNSSQILSSITQDVNFNSRPQVGAFQAFQTVNRPTLRYLGASASGGSSTLLLLDGHRLPGMGIFQTTPDLDAITPGAIERIETVTGGGSATYGSDAVGGVMNIISRRRFDGLEIGGHYGVGEDYNQWDVSTTAGKAWDALSIWGSYSYSQNSMVRFRDRDYARNWDYVRNLPADTACSPGNALNNGVQVTTPSLANRCDNFLDRAFFPESRRHSAMLGLSADLSDTITFDVRAFYANRKSTTSNGPQSYTINVVDFADPARPVVDGQTIAGNFSNLFGRNTYATSTLKTWGITPQLTAKLGGDWRVVAFYNYGKGISRFGGNDLVNATDLQAAYANQLFDPIAGTFAASAAGQTAQTNIRNRFNFSEGRDEIHNGRVTLDGPLFDIGSGNEVRVAVGGEILHESYSITTANGVVGATPFARRANNRTVKSLFGELSVPLVGEDNSIPFIHSFNVSLSGRYDHYDDFGGTFNPKVGVTWQPVAGFTIRGNWAKSFQAPSLAERNDVSPASLSSYPAFYLGYPSPKTALFLYPGSGPNLQPQKATSWEVGVDIKPETIPGLSISGTYYKIKFTDRIGAPPFYVGTQMLLQFPNKVTVAPIEQQVRDFVAQASLGTDNAEQFIKNPSSVYGLIDARSINLSSLNTSGFDFNINYGRDTGFGRIFGQVSGSLVLSYDVLAFNGGPTTRLRDNSVSELRLSAMVGATIGDFTGRATMQRTSGYRIAPTAAALNQDWIGGLTVFNLSFNYDLKGEGVLKDTSLSLNVDNVFNVDPPRYNGIVNTSQPGYALFTLGRVFQFGIRKKF